MDADSIAINRLTVRGNKHASQALVHEVQHTGWSLPLPSHLQHAWVLVRQLDVSGKLGDLRHIAGRELQAQVLAARDFRAGGAARDNAVWFESFPVLLAFLLADIASGQAAKWYWERWSYLLKYTRQEAIARVFFEHAAYLPAIVSCLNKRGQLQRVWSQLSSDNARVITRELARMHSLPSVDMFGLGSETYNLQSGGDKALRSHESIQPGSAPSAADLEQLKPAAYWQALLASLPPNDGRIVLAASLQGLSHAPLWLKRSPHTLLAVFTAWVYNHGGAQTPKTVKNGAATLTQKAQLTEQPSIAMTQMAESVGQAPVSGSGLNDPLRTELAPKSVPDMPISRHGTRNFKPAKSHEVNALTTYPDEKKYKIAGAETAVQSDIVLGDSYAEPVLSNSAIQEYGANFFTTAGGFFYLLNPLNRLLTPELLMAQTQASGWQWLWDLHRLLALEFPHLQSLFDWPFKRFLLQQMAPNATEYELQQLAMQWESTAPSDFATALFERLSDHFKKDSFWLELAETTGFLSSPAQVVATTSHIDIYLSLNHVRLDLRLAAWDTNPGWLPWLGRVVAFHYLEQPQNEQPLNESPLSEQLGSRNPQGEQELPQ